MLTVKESDSAHLLTKLLQEGVKFLNEDPDALLCLQPEKATSDSISFFLGERLCGRTVVSNVQRGS